MKAIRDAFLLIVTAAAIFAQSCGTTDLPYRFRYQDGIPARKNELVLCWLGAAGYEVRKGKTTILIDPFISRPSFTDVLFGTIKPNKKMIAREMAKRHLGREVDSWLLQVDDLKDPASLVSKLRDSGDSLSKYLWKQFSSHTRQLLKKYNGTSPPSKSLQRTLIDELNQLLQDGNLYDAQRFAHVKLTKEIKELIKQKLQGEDIVRLNRLLLENAYSREISKKQRVDYIFVSHSHYDHLLDVGTIANMTKATVVGSKSSCNILRSRHIPERRLIEVKGGEEIDVGAFKVKIVRSLHAKTFLGIVPYSGEVTGIITRPTRAVDYRVGKVFGFLFQEKETGFTFYHNGSANLIDENLEGLKADLVIMSIAHMNNTKNYVKRLVTALEPKTVIPTHYDNFYEPLDKGVQPMVGVDIEDFVKKVHAVNPDIQVLTLNFFQEYIPERREAGSHRENHESHE